MAKRIGYPRSPSPSTTNTSDAGSSDSEEIVLEPLQPFSKRQRSEHASSDGDEPRSPTSTTDLWHLLDNTSIDAQVRATLHELDFTLDEALPSAKQGVDVLHLPKISGGEPMLAPVDDVEELLWRLADPDGGKAEATQPAVRNSEERRPEPAVAPPVANTTAVASGVASTTSGLSHNRKEWSAWEDETIRIGVSELGLRWRAIASRLPGRSDDAVRNRWARLQSGGGSSGVVIDGIEGLHTGAVAAPVVSARHASASRQKRDNSETRHSWTAEEDAIITASVNEWGRRWNRIADRLPKRTEHAIRNRWHRLQMAMLDEQHPPASAPSSAGRTCAEAERAKHEPALSLDLDSVFTTA